MFAATAALVALVWLAGLFVPSHVSLQTPRAAPLPSTADGWSAGGSTGHVLPDASGTGGGLTVASHAVDTVRLAADVPLERPADAEAWLRVSGRIIERERRAASSGTAAVGVRFVAADGRAFGYRNLRFVPRRASALERFSAVVAWPAGAVGAHVSLVSRPGAPTFTLHDARVELVAPNPFHAVSMVALVLAAFAWLALLLRFAAAHGAVVPALVPAAATLAIAIGVTLSGAVLRPVLLPSLAALESVLGLDRASGTVAIMKGGHAFAFFLLSVGLLSSRRRLRLGRSHVVAFAALLAIGSEGLQSHLSARHASPLDVLVDLAGVLLALLVFELLDSTRRRRKGRDRLSRRRAARELPV